ncbi:hypothetical protein NE237_007372 [Protea cynaroides]|uniref:Fe2OG dioxygenase domain-containing protein n=1 Tax=Protea cynaroides TaxID=273540 RepID=A0A9Q0KP61_9MAGN|nr:hypothetical protein NE237_007372 [Protea cynaroides]
MDNVRVEQRTFTVEVWIYLDSSTLVSPPSLASSSIHLNFSPAPPPSQLLPLLLHLISSPPSIFLALSQTIDLSSLTKSATLPVSWASSRSPIMVFPLRLLTGQSPIAGIKAFNEQSPEMKVLHYNRDMGRSVSYSSNLDLYISKVATWRDTIIVRWGPNIEVSEIPEICRSEIVQWYQQVKRLVETLTEMLSEGLGVSCGGIRLKAMSCTGGTTMDQIGGLQIKDGEHWVDVQPVLNAIIINIGELLQVLSNGVYRSMEHRVLANHLGQPRISVAIFFNPSKKKDFYGPLPELISPEKPALYRPFTLLEFLMKFFTKELGDKSLISNFQL